MQLGRGLVAWLSAVASMMTITPARPAVAAPQPLAVITKGTPVLSIRRMPAWLETTTATQRLSRGLAGLAAPTLDVLGGPAGCVLAKQGTRTLYALDPDGEFLPASNMKLLTGLAALDRLGPAGRLTTRAVAAQPPNGGVIDGNLYLVGGGDPLLRTAAFVSKLNPPQPTYTSLDELAAAVRRAGVQKVTGSVVGDDSRYDDQRAVPSWNPIYLTEGDVAPLSALEVNDDVPAAPDSDASTPPDPPTNSAAAFATLLAADGVSVAGQPSAGRAPAGSTQVAAIQSPTVAQEVDSMLTISDDTAAELFTKELGYRTSGAGTTSAGLAVVRADLAGHGIDLAGTVMADGSGLDRQDRTSCRSLVSLLQAVGPKSSLAEGLPVAGETGTLRKRLTGTEAAGRLKAKTGTLADVAALSGFITPDPKRDAGAVLLEPLTFSMLVNGTPFAQGEDLIDRMATELASYPDVPPIASVGPLATTADGTTGPGPKGAGS